MRFLLGILGFGGFLGSVGYLVWSLFLREKMSDQQSGYSPPSRKRVPVRPMRSTSASDFSPPRPLQPAVETPVEEIEPSGDMGEFDDDSLGEQAPPALPPRMKVTPPMPARPPGGLGSGLQPPQPPRVKTDTLRDLFSNEDQVQEHDTGEDDDEMGSGTDSVEDGPPRFSPGGGGLAPG